MGVEIKGNPLHPVHRLARQTEGLLNEMRAQIANADLEAGANRADDAAAICKRIAQRLREEAPDHE
jgi:hypothetical protein